MKKFLIFSSAFLLFTTSCTKESCQEDPCSDDAFCTAVFVTVGVQIKDNQDNPVKLDAAYTIRKKTGEKIIFTQDQTAGRYHVLQDNFTNKLANRSEEFQFIGIKNNKTVVSETYLIGGDCCHIYKLSGKETVVASF